MRFGKSVLANCTTDVFVSNDVSTSTCTVFMLVLMKRLSHCTSIAAPCRLLSMPLAALSGVGAHSQLCRTHLLSRLPASRGQHRCPHRVHRDLSSLAALSGVGAHTQLCRTHPLPRFPASRGRHRCPHRRPRLLPHRLHLLRHLHHLLHHKQVCLEIWPGSPFLWKIMARTGPCFPTAIL